MKLRLGINGFGRIGRSVYRQLLNNEHISCPQCGSKNTEMKSMFGSTACKALFVCKKCLEPFDYFKCI